MSKLLSHQQLKEEAARQGYEGSVQFPMYFDGGGTVIFQDPNLMQHHGGAPTMNPRRYLAEHHPERLSEYEKGVKAQLSTFGRLDKEVQRTTKRVEKEEKKGWFW